MENIIKKPYEISLWEDQIWYAKRCLQIVESKEEDHAQGLYYVPVSTDVQGNVVYKIDYEPYDAEKTYYAFVPKSEGNYIEDSDITKLNNWEPSEDYDGFPTVLTQFYKEKKLCIIGSDTMDSPSRAVQPKLTEKVNGEVSLTFSIYYRYFDEEMGEFVFNPFHKLLTNERKIKLRYGALNVTNTKWYDLIIKNITEDSNNYSFTYTCKSLHINELSKTGFGIVLDSELENNTGNVTSLAKTILRDTDWQVNDKDSDDLKQYIEEPLYLATLSKSITAYKMENGNNSEGVTFEGEDEIYVFYSMIKNQTSYFQFLAISEDTDSDYVLLNNENYYCENVEYTDGKPDFIKDFSIAEGLRGKRLVRQLKTEYEPVLDRYVNIYKKEKSDAVYRGYEDTEYFSPIAVRNYITNPNGFVATTGWDGFVTNGESKIPNIEVIGYPDVRDSTAESKDFKSFIYATIEDNNQVIFNSGFYDNKNVIYNNLVEDKEYIIKLKLYTGTFTEKTGWTQISDLEQLWNGPSIKICSYSLNEGILSVNEEDVLFQVKAYEKSGEELINLWVPNPAQQEERFIYQKTSCLKSVSYKDLLEKKYGIFLYFDKGKYLIEDFQIFEYVEKEEDFFYLPTDTPLAEVKTKYYYYQDNINYETEEDINYLYSGYSPQLIYKPVYNDENKKFEKIRSITAKESNCFNLIQDLNETFECWSIFSVEHDPSSGAIILDDNYRQKKNITFKENVGQYNWAGFKRGINLKSTKRTLESDAIVSKMIVKDNANEFGQNGFCSIARAKDNPTGENFIIDFSYYFRNKLLNLATVTEDLYLDINGSLGYYKKLQNFNLNREEYIEQLAGLIIEISDYQAQYKAVQLAKENAEREIVDLKETIEKISGHSFANIIKVSQGENIDGAEGEDEKTNNAKGWLENDEIIKAINSISFLQGVVAQSEKSYNTYYANYNASSEKQKEIEKKLEDLTEKKRRLNLQFYKKYSRFLQEGTWTEENYVDDNLYFLDAQNIARTSASPKVSYTFSIVELSQLEGYENYKFNLGDISYIEDVEFFGWKLENGVYSPAREEIVVSECTYALDSPEQNTLKVQNYKTQFEDLFQRIAATTQSIDYHTGEYEKAASIIQPDGTINFDSLQGSITNNSLILENAKDQSTIIDEFGITSTNLSRPSEVIRLVSGGLFISNDGGQTWTTGVSGSGINANNIVAGELYTSKVTIMSGGYPSFRWNEYGLSAYEFKFNKTTGIPQEFNYAKFVRLDQYGLYGISGNTDFKPKSEDDIWDNNATKFALTWKGFKLKSNDIGGYISITSQNDFQVLSNNKERIKIGRISPDGAKESIYGIRISDANGASVMETGSDGELWLKKALRVNANKGKVSIGYISDFIDDIHGSQVINASSESGSFIVYEDGYMTASGGTFDGTINANSGSIGGINITEKGLDVINGSITIYKDDYALDDTVNSGTFNNNIYYQKNDSGDYIVAEDFNEETDYYVKQQKAVFSQDGNGNLIMSGTIYATDGSFAGTVNATNGNIGGFIIKSDQLYSTNFKSISETPTDGILLDGFNGKAYFKNAILGSGLVIQDQIELGEARIYNPDVHHDKFIKTGNISIDQNGCIEIGNIKIYGGTESDEISYIKGGDYINTTGGWIIYSDGKAYFRDIIVNDAHIRNSILEIGTVQSMGSLMLFEDCYTVASISEDEKELTLDKLALFKEGDWIYSDNNKYYKIKKAENRNDVTIITLEDDYPFDNSVNSIIAKFGASGIDSVFSVWGANATTNNKGMYPFAHNNAIVLSEFTEEKGIFNFKKKLILGNLNGLEDEIEGLSGYGLYADNVYLNGSLTTKVSSENSATYAGINTLSGAVFNKDKTNSDKSKVIFWAGSNSTNTSSIQDAPFQVTEAGTVYASKAIFTNSVFAGGAITGADLFATRLHGWADNGSAALTIYDTTSGISFQTGYDYEKKSAEEAKETFSISSDGFKIGGNSFIKIPSSHEGYNTQVDFIGSLETNFITALDVNNTIVVEAENTQISKNFYIGKNDQTNNLHQMQYKAVDGKDGGYDLYVV